MSTRAEQKRYEDERKHPSKRDSKLPRSSRSGEPGEHPKARVAKNAVFAIEKRAQDGTASRKSTRSSANHARADHGLQTKEANEGRTPTAVHAREAARTQKSHGHAPPSLRRG